MRKDNNILLLAVVAILLDPFCHGIDVRSLIYKTIYFDSAPTILADISGVSDELRCAAYCNHLADSPCTGFRLTSGRCVLYKGNVMAKTDGVATSSDLLAYRVTPLPKCQDYPDFVVKKTWHRGAYIYFCFMIKNEEADYETAKRDCTSRGAYLTFVDTDSKFHLLEVEHNAHRRQPFWIGVRKEDGTDVFKGDYQNKVIFTNNSAIFQYPPDTSDPRKVCLAGEINNKASIKDCSDLCYYSCEIPEFSQ